MEKIFIDGYIGEYGYSLPDLRASVESLQSKEFELHINSGGGDVNSGFAMYDYLKSLTDYKITTIGTGIVGSIATVVFSAGNIRKLHSNTDFFIHNPYWTPDAPIPMEASEAQGLANDLKRAEDKILSFYVKHSNKSVDELSEKMKAQTTLSASEAVEWGFADEIIGEPVTNAKRYTVKAFINNNKSNEMANITEILAAFEKKILAAVTPKIKAEMHKTSEGVDIFYEGELAQGTEVFTDESRTTPAPDGVHTVGNIQFEIKEGKVVSVAEVSADTEALKAEVEKLKAQLAEKETAIANANSEKGKIEAELAEAKTNLTNLSTEFKNFKSQIVTETGELKPEIQNFKGQGDAKRDLVAETLELRKAKAQGK